MKDLLKRLTPSLRAPCPSCQSVIHAFDATGMKCPNCGAELKHEEMRSRMHANRVAYKRKRLKKSRQAGTLDIVVPNSKLAFFPGLIFAFFLTFALRNFPLPLEMQSWHVGLGVAVLVFFIAGRPWHVNLTRTGVEVKRLFSPFVTRANWSARFEVVRSVRRAGERRPVCLNAIEEDESTTLLTTYSKTTLEALLEEIHEFEQNNGL